MPRRFLKSKKDIRQALLALVLLLYVICGILLLDIYQYQINSDGIYYLSLSQKYIRFDFANAINGYWSPLISWLLIPLLLIKVPPLLATKLLSLFIGVFCLLGIAYLSLQFKIRNLISNVLWFAAIPLVLYFSFWVISPDFLLTTILIYYLAVILKPNYFTKLRYGFLCGALGSLAYYAKAYAFPFFLVHFFIFHALSYYQAKSKTRKRNLIKNYFGGVLIFLSLSSIWIGLLSIKYNRITFSTTALHNYMISAPSVGKKIPDSFLAQPPNKTAINFYEDPSYQEENLQSPFLTSNAFLHQWRIITQNMRITLLGLGTFSCFAYFMLMSYLLFFLYPLRTIKKRLRYFFILMTMILFAGGYILINVELRYIWILGILTLMISGEVLTIYFQKFITRPLFQTFSLILLALSFVFFPIFILYRDRYVDQDIFLYAQTLKKLKVQGNFISNRQFIHSLYLAYHLKSKYYGYTGELKNKGQLSEIDQILNTDYYLYWHENGPPPEYLTNYPEITQNQLAELKVYSLRNETSN